jgi:hypothetical protein
MVQGHHQQYQILKSSIIVTPAKLNLDKKVHFSAVTTFCLSVAVMFQVV